jgi:uncharacterized membrane protein
MLAVLYDWLKLGHILMAIVWVGGALTMQLLATRVQRVGTRTQLVEMTGHIEFVATRLFIPASLILVILGVWMVIIGPWDFGMVWIDLAIAMFVYSFISGSLYLSPQMRKVKEVVEREGPESAQVSVLASRIFLVSRIELVFLVLIVADMVLKPFL